MDRFGAGVHRPLDPLAEELAEVLARGHVVHVAPVRDHPAVSILLRLVHVTLAVEPAVEVVLVLSPGDARHEVRDIALGPPLGDPLR